MSKKKYILENRLYNIGLVFLVLGIATILILKAVLPEGFEISPCMFYMATGYYCPGCGGTRAVLYLLSGNLLTSLVYHPLVLYVAGIYVVFMISHTIEKCEAIYYRRKKSTRERYPIMGLKFRPWYLYGAIVVIFVNVVVKNILIYMEIWHN